MYNREEKICWDLNAGYIDSYRLSDITYKTSWDDVKDTLHAARTQIVGYDMRVEEPPKYFLFFNRLAWLKRERLLDKELHPIFRRAESFYWKTSTDTDKTANRHKANIIALWFYTIKANLAGIDGAEFVESLVFEWGMERAIKILMTAMPITDLKAALDNDIDVDLMLSTIN